MLFNINASRNASQVEVDRFSKAIVDHLPLYREHPAWSQSEGQPGRKRPEAETSTGSTEKAGRWKF